MTARQWLAGGGGHVPVAVSSRSGADESVHFGSAVIVGPDGAIVDSFGNPDLPIYPRSALKPLQAAAMLSTGLEVTTEQLALMCASHDGTERHRAVARSILESAGLDDDALGNVAALPIDTEAAHALVRAGAGASALAMNCSGKHAGMLAACVVNGWPTDSYLDPDHPLQQHITSTIRGLAGGVAHIGIDGCGAPTHVLELAGLARAFARAGTTAPPVAAAMVAHPDLVGGAHRPITRLMVAVPGLVAKDGAEGVCAAALPDGGAVAVKIADGASRAWPVVMCAALELAGVDVSPVPDDLGPPVLGHGRAVGGLRACLRR